MKQISILVYCDEANIKILINVYLHKSYSTHCGYFIENNSTIEIIDIIETIEIIEIIEK